MINKDILPAVSAYIGKVSATAAAKKSCFADADFTYEENTVKKLSSLSASIYKATNELETSLAEIKTLDAVEKAGKFRDVIIPKMEEIRSYSDAAECITGAEYWPFPTYADLLYGVR